MSASPKFVPVQHYDQSNAVYTSVKMTSPDRKKELVMPREVENGIHNDMTRYNGGDKNKVVHNTERYNMNDMKINNVGENFSGDKFTTTNNKKDFMNHNSSMETLGQKLPPYDELNENNCNNEKENRVSKCDDEFGSLSNGKGSNNSEKTETRKVDDVGRGDNSFDISNKKNTNNEIIDLKELNSDLIPEDSVLVNDFDGGAEVSKASRISRQLEKIEQLKEDLRCEEATLNILRKLIESQRGKNGYKSTTKHQPPIPSLHPKQPAQIAPKVEPPKQPQFQPGKTPLQPAANAAPVQKYYVQIGNQLVPAPPPGTAGSGPIYQYANGGTPNSHTSYQPPPPKPAPPPKQTPEQKQNAAKAALRRQLEQTLLQIPPPRPPPADWRAIPNVNSMDFMMLVGLDEVVDNILDMDAKPTLKTALEELMPYNPRICSQCRVDFSPCWKNKDGNSKDFVLCERCALQNVKKELKAEHTSRLKSAFLKALKQEQEIEEKIKAGEDVNIGNITGSEKTENSQSPVSVPSSCARISSPKSAVTAPGQASSNHAPSSSDRHHQSSTGHHHRLQVVQHYPHHSPLVQQLHHQHLQQQQQQLEQDPSAQRHSSRWHPYLPPSSGHHHRDHHQGHHRSYVPVSSSASVEPNLHQEYYVVHHPQHAGVRYINR